MKDFQKIQGDSRTVGHIAIKGRIEHHPPLSVAEIGMNHAMDPPLCKKIAVGIHHMVRQPYRHGRNMRCHQQVGQHNRLIGTVDGSLKSLVVRIPEDLLRRAGRQRAAAVVFRMVAQPLHQVQGLVEGLSLSGYFEQGKSPLEFIVEGKVFPTIPEFLRSRKLISAGQLYILPESLHDRGIGIFYQRLTVLGKSHSTSPLL